MPGLRHIATSAAILLAAATLAACAASNSDTPGQVIARVGDTPITQATLTHWITVLRGGTAASDPAGAQKQGLRQQALQFLISSHWLIGEAASRGISISGLEVRRQIDRIEQVDFPGGVAELREFLRSTGQSVADVELQARTELASAKLRQMAIASAGEISGAQVAAYYAQHKRRFLIPEQREARFTNRKRKAAAEKVKREVEAGKSLTSPGQRRVGELFARAHVPPGDPYERAIDSAKPYSVAGPFKLGNDYWLYQVVRIVPARQQTLAEVAGSIRRQLTSERTQAALRDRIETWTAEWKAKTDCQPGYVVQRCRQYRGPETTEERFAVS